MYVAEPAVPTDIMAPVVAAFTGFETQLLSLAAIGIGVALVAWGIPRGVRFIKKLAS